MATHKKKHVKNINTTKELIFCSKPDNEYYGQIIAPKGDSRFEVKIIFNNSIVMAKARGILISGPNKDMIEKIDYVLLQKDISNNNKYYIMRKYSANDVRKLKKAGELAGINDSNIDSNNDNDNNPIILFDDDVLLNKQEEIEINGDFIANI